MRHKPDQKSTIPVEIFRYFYCVWSRIEILCPGLEP